MMGNFRARHVLEGDNGVFRDFSSWDMACLVDVV